jgi:hypothetical protein
LIMARTLSALALLGGLALVAAGCCNPAKAPGRCTACIYDNCIVPTFSAAPPAIPTSEDRLPEAPAAVPMAY